ncbi:MAG: hypothetical protein ACT4NT_07450 [Nitrososphaerota archaeon]
MGSTLLDIYRFKQLVKAKAKFLFAIAIASLVFTILSFTGQIPNLIDSTQQDPITQQIVGIVVTVTSFLYLGEFTYGIIRGVIKKKKREEDTRFLLKNITTI